MAAQSGERPTKAELNRRIHAVERLLIDGKTRYAIVQYGSKNWGVTWRTTDKYISRANKRIRKALDVDLEEYKSYAIRRYNRLYSKALAEGDIRAAADIQKKLSELLGLNAPVKSEGTMNLILESIRERQEASRKRDGDMSDTPDLGGIVR